MRMTYEEFKDAVIARKDEFLPADMQNAEVEFRRNNKLNNSYEALMIQIPGDVVTASINMNAIYEKCKDGPLSAAIAELRENVRGMELDKVAQMAKESFLMGDYENVKDLLYIRCSNAGRNAEVLENCPHATMQDLAMTVHVGLDWGSENEPNYSTTVTNQLMEKWGISEGELFADAIANSEEKFPLSMRPLSEIMQEMMGGVPMPTGGPDLYVLSNAGTQFGAASVFYPNALKEAHEQLGDFYMLPSSVHEWLLLPEGMGPDVAELEVMVRSINITEVSPEDFLSNEVYHFDGKQMEHARTYEARMNLGQEMEQQMNVPEPDLDEKAMTM